MSIHDNSRLKTTQKFEAKHGKRQHVPSLKKERQTDFQQSRLNTKGHSDGIVPPSEAL